MMPASSQLVAIRAYSAMRSIVRSAVGSSCRSSAICEKKVELSTRISSTRGTNQGNHVYLRIYSGEGQVFAATGAGYVRRSTKRRDTGGGIRRSPAREGDAR